MSIAGVNFGRFSDFEPFFWMFLGTVVKNDKK